MKMDVYYENQGYKRISIDRVTDLNAPTHQGIDGVYYNPDGHPPYIIGEGKYGSGKLGTTLDGPQMSTTCIEGGKGSSRLDEVREDRIYSVKKKIDSLKFGVLVAKYSYGEDLNRLKTDFVQLLNDMPLYWNNNSNYVEMLWMMSLAILFDVNKEQFLFCQI